MKKYLCLVAVFCFSVFSLSASAEKNNAENLVLMPVRGVDLLVADIFARQTGNSKSEADESDGSFEAYMKKMQADFEAFKRGAPSAEEIQRRKQADAKALTVRMAQEVIRLQKAIERVLIEELQVGYEVIFGEPVNKAIADTSQRKCDDDQCIRSVASSLESKLAAVASISKMKNGYFLEVQIKNFANNKVVFNNSTHCAKCDEFQVVIKFKSLSALPVNSTPVAYVAPAVVPVDKIPGQLEKFRDCDDCPEMVVLPTGRFEMGSAGGEFNETPMHKVTIASPFAIGVTEVTQAQWSAVMGGDSEPSNHKKCPTCPVESVNREDALKFIEMLSDKTGKTYRLPSEAEWEYACRAGQRKKFCAMTDNAEGVAWTRDRGGKLETHPVASLQPNAWGLHDMSGNVSEMVADFYALYKQTPRDGSALLKKIDTSETVCRGGSWDSNDNQVRSSFRYSCPSGGNWTLGFRVVRVMQ